MSGQSAFPRSLNLQRLLEKVRPLASSGISRLAKLDRRILIGGGVALLLLIVAVAWGVNEATRGPTEAEYVNATSRALLEFPCSGLHANTPDCLNGPALAREFVTHPERRVDLWKRHPDLFTTPTILDATDMPYRDISIVRQQALYAQLHERSPFSKSAPLVPYEVRVEDDAGFLADTYCNRIEEDEKNYRVSPPDLQAKDRESRPDEFPAQLYDGSSSPSEKDVAAYRAKLCADSLSITRDYVKNPQHRSQLAKQYPYLLDGPDPMARAGMPYTDAELWTSDNASPEAMATVSRHRDPNAAPPNITNTIGAIITWLALNPLIPLLAAVVVGILEPQFRHVMSQLPKAFFRLPADGPARLMLARFKDRKEQVRVRAEAMILAPAVVFCTSVLIGKAALMKVTPLDLSLVPLAFFACLALVAALMATGGTLGAAIIAWKLTSIWPEASGPTRGTFVMNEADKTWVTRTQGEDPTARERHGDQPHAPHSGPVRTIAERDLHTGALSDKIIGDPSVTPPPPPKTTSGEKGTARELELKDLKERKLVIDGDEL